MGSREQTAIRSETASVALDLQMHCEQNRGRPCGTPQEEAEEPSCCFHCGEEPSDQGLILGYSKEANISQGLLRSLTEGWLGRKELN